MITLWPGQGFTSIYTPNLPLRGSRKTPQGEPISPPASPTSTRVLAWLSILTLEQPTRILWLRREEKSRRPAKTMPFKARKNWNCTTLIRERTLKMITCVPAGRNVTTQEIYGSTPPPTYGWLGWLEPGFLRRGGLGRHQGLRTLKLEISICRFNFPNSRLSLTKQFSRQSHLFINKSTWRLFP